MSEDRWYSASIKTPMVKLMTIVDETLGVLVDMPPSDRLKYSQQIKMLGELLIKMEERNEKSSATNLDGFSNEDLMRIAKQSIKEIKKLPDRVKEIPYSRISVKDYKENNPDGVGADFAFPPKEGQ
jgi:hypothetical protein